MLSNAGYSRRQLGKTYLVGIRQIVQRDSTHPLSDSGLLVQKALAYIEHNALKGIGVQDVAHHLNVSYSLLNLRFHELQHETLYETILRHRLEAVRERLASTHEAIDDIASRCGWPVPASLKKLFKQRYGVSMRDWRRQQAV